MKLTLSERYVLPEILPQEGSLAEQGMVKTICEKAQPTDEEKERFGIRQDGTTIQWNPSIDNSTEMGFTEAETALIKTSVLKLDENKKVTQRNLSLCRKILGL